MTTRQLDRHQWQSYFDEISRHLEATTVNLEISSAELGNQKEATHQQLIGFSYDERSDIFSIITESMEHRIAAPTQVAVRERGGHLMALDVIDGEGRHHVAHLRRASRLSAR